MQCNSSTLWLSTAAAELSRLHPVDGLLWVASRGAPGNTVVVGDYGHAQRCVCAIGQTSVLLCVCVCIVMRHTALTHAPEWPSENR